MIDCMCYCFALCSIFIGLIALEVQYSIYLRCMLVVLQFVSSLLPFDQRRDGGDSTRGRKRSHTVASKFSESLESLLAAMTK